MRGAHSGGFRTAVQPAASAGPTFQVESMKGAFQGVISAATPDGSWRTRFSTPFASQVRSSRSSASWAKKRTLRAPRFMTRSREASRSEPLSSVSTAASVSTFSSIRSASRKRCSARPSGPRAAQAGNASRAASTAASTSAATTTGHVGKRTLVDRRDVRERLRRTDPLTADEMVGRNFDAGDGCRGGTHIPTRVGSGRPATRFERTPEKRTCMWRPVPDSRQI